MADRLHGAHVDRQRPTLHNVRRSLSDAASHWQGTIQSINGPGVPQFPLDVAGLAFAHEHPGQIHQVDWGELLAGGENTAFELDFSAEEISNWQDILEILRQWDIDSVIASASTLAVHRGGFRLSYSPLFHGRITQNQRIRIKGHKLHQVKQLEAGRGLLSGGLGYKCYMLFPKMPLSDDGETFLTLEAQRLWYDEVILPALRHACPADVCQHHPSSFSDLRYKANVKQECFPTGAGQPIDIQELIPEQYVEAFWARVVELSNGPGSPGNGQFQDVFLVVCCHGMKLSSKSETVAGAADALKRSFQTCFAFDTADPSWECWVDLGIEDTPVHDAGVTLLRKSQCLRQWAQCFACPDHDKDLIRTTEYPWNTTRDAGSASVELLGTNSLRSRGDIAYNKAYNTNKEMFATPLKGYDLFQNPQFEALPFSQSLIEKWYDLNSRAGSKGYVRKREQLITAYCRTKQRLSTALASAANSSFAARQEFRVSYRLLEYIASADGQGRRHPRSGSMDSESTAISAGSARGGGRAAGTKLTTVNLDESTRTRSTRATASLASEAGNDRPGAHRPFWILPTKAVNAFMAAQMNRWLLILEVLICRTNHTLNGKPVLAEEQQLMNGAMASTVLRLLRYGSNGDAAGPGMQSILAQSWRSRVYKSRSSRNARPDVPEVAGDDDDSYVESEEDESGSERPGQQGSTLQHGVGISDCIERYGIAWLPRDKVLWNTEYPTFTAEAMRTLAVTKNGFQRSFSKTSNIQRKIQDEDTTFTALGHLLGGEDAEEQRRGFHIAAEMVVQDYVKSVIAILASRWTGGSKSPRTKTQLKEFISFAEMSEGEAAGLEGLTYDLASRMVGGVPRVVQARPDRAGGRARNGSSMFGVYNTGLWIDKVHALFAWDDEATEGAKARGWQNASFRLLAQRLRRLVQQEAGDEGVQRFKVITQKVAAQKLWVILQYDFDKLSVMYKPSKCHSQDTKDWVTQLTQLEKTNWAMAQVAQRYRCSTTRPGHQDCYPRPRNPHGLDDAIDDHAAGGKARSGVCKKGLRHGEVQVYGYFDHTICFPLRRQDIYPPEACEDPWLSHLAEFTREIRDARAIQSEE